MPALRRDPGAILAAHQLDPKRRELYVEGLRDSSFLAWLVAGRRGRDVAILEIDQAVQMPISIGGARARLLEFARTVGPAGAQIAYFADADEDAIAGQPAIASCWFTDGRDLEGYLFRADCFAKLASLAALVGPDDFEAVRVAVLGSGRTLGLLRVTSVRLSLALPYQQARLHRFARFADGRFELSLEAYVRSLVNQAGESMKLTATLLSALEETTRELSETPTELLLHGKDALALLGIATKPYRIPSVEVALWLTFERPMAEEYANLRAVLGYLEGREDAPS